MCVFTIGCWFGDLQSKNWDSKVWVENVSECDIRTVNCQISFHNLCRKLTVLPFSEEQLKQGNATEAGTSRVTLLDPYRLYAIRGDIILNYSAPIYLHIKRRKFIICALSCFSLCNSLSLQIPTRVRI